MLVVTLFSNLMYDIKNQSNESQTYSGVSSCAGGAESMFELPTRDLIEDALSASANATCKIVFLVLIGVVATAQGTIREV
jgi:hypothetical protein